MTRTLAVLVVFAACGAPPRSAAPPAAPPAKSVQVNQPGAAVDLDAVLVAGRVTVVDFWSESCAACTVVGGMLAVQTALDPAIVIRKIDVGDGFTPVAEAFKIGALPHYKVYDKQRRLRYELVGNDCLMAPEVAKQLAAEP